MDASAVNEIMSMIGGSIVDSDSLQTAINKYGNDKVIEVKIIRDAIRDDLWGIIEKSNKGWSLEELENYFLIYMGKNYPEFDKDKFKSILGFLGWMCWHEGYLKT